MPAVSFSAARGVAQHIHGICAHYLADMDELRGADVPLKRLDSLNQVRGFPELQRQGAL